MASAMPNPWLPSQPPSITAPRPVQNYTARKQKHMFVNNLLKVLAWKWHDWDSNLWQLSHKSNILTVTPPDVTRSFYSSATCSIFILHMKQQPSSCWDNECPRWSSHNSFLTGKTFPANRLPKSQANCDFCRHFLLMLNFYVSNVLQGIWNRSR